MKRIFYDKQTGEVMGVNYLHPKYFNGTLVDDLTRPKTKLVNDKTKPIYIEEDVIVAKRYEDGKIVIDKDGKPEFTVEKARRQIGYEKKEGPNGYEKKALTYLDSPVPVGFEDYGFYWTADDLPVHEYTNQMIVADEVITVDTDKSKTLMPEKIIARKHIDYVTGQIKNETDPSKKVDLYLERETLLGRKPVGFWYEKAKENLVRAEIEKPIIEAKLDAKIKEIKNG